MKNIMKRAWKIYRELKGDRIAKLSQALRMAWAERKNKNAEKVINVHYSVYKNQYSNFETVKGSYNAATKTIEVIVPADEKKCKIKQLGNVIGNSASRILFEIETAMEKANNNVDKAITIFQMNVCGYKRSDVTYFFKRLGLVK